MSTTPAKSDLILANRGTRRVIVGPGPRSKGGGKMVRFDTDKDSKVPAEKRLGDVHILKGADADRVRGSKVFEAVKDRLKLQAG